MLVRPPQFYSRRPVCAIEALFLRGDFAVP
jgi:hypothetical protein